MTAVRPHVRRLLELVALTGLAVTQPLLSVFGRSPDYFIFRVAETRDIVLFAVLIALVPALGLWLVELGIGLFGARARDRSHMAILGALAVLFTLQAAKRAFGVEGALLIVVGVLVGAGAAFAFVRVNVARLWLVMLSPAAAVFVVLFLVSSPVSGLVFPEAVDVAELEARERAPSVVMLTLDEWPTASILDAQGQVDGRLFPNLAALARTTTWHRNATTVSTSTWHAVPAILTGRFPKNGQGPYASFHRDNLFTLFGGSYRLRVSEATTRLCPPALCAVSDEGGGLGGLLGDASETYARMVSPRRARGDVTASFEERAADNAADQGAGTESFDLGGAIAGRLERFEEFLGGMRRGEEPTLHFLHVLLPHVPYRFLPAGAEYALPDRDFGKEPRREDDWITDPWPSTLARQRMLLQVGYLDRLIGRLLDRLRATGLYDRSVVVVTADHGIAFDPGKPARGLSDTPVPADLYPQLLWAPLFVKAPGQTGGRVNDDNVMTIDVLPTIADLAGVKLPWAVDGRSAARGAPRATDEKVFMKPTVTRGFGVGLGPPITFDGRAGEQRMLEGNLEGVLEPGPPATRLFRLRGTGAIVGRKLEDLTVGASSGLRGQVDRRDAFTRVELGRGPVPALVWGRLTGAVTSTSVEVAIVVNGTVGGVSGLFSDDEAPNRFAAVVPDDLLRNGRNDVRLFQVVRASGEVELRPIALVG